MPQQLQNHTLLQIIEVEVWEKKIKVFLVLLFFFRYGSQISFACQSQLPLAFRNSKDIKNKSCLIKCHSKNNIKKSVLWQNGFSSLFCFSLTVVLLYYYFIFLEILYFFYIIFCWRRKLMTIWVDCVFFCFLIKLNDVFMYLCIIYIFWKKTLFSRTQHEFSLLSVF